MLNARYIERGRKDNIDQITDFLKGYIPARIKSTYITAKERKDLKDGLNQAGTDPVKRLAESIKGLNDALLDGREVFLECVKEPRNLDRGRHYYDLYYINADGRAVKFWAGEYFYHLIGQERQTRDNYISRFIYSSGAIGMSRSLDATDGLFNFLKDITGTYCQIS